MNRIRSEYLVNCVTEKLEHIKIENVINFITFALNSFAQLFESFFCVHGMNGSQNRALIVPV